jgi:diketogulonate reductase-like aldo/keto reductase
MEPLRVITQTESWSQEVQVDVVERLSELLKMAKAGEIQGIAYSALNADGSVSFGYTKTSDQNAILGGLVRVQYRMVENS